MEYTGRIYEGFLNKQNVGLNGVFCYGANIDFIHGAGTALIAKKEFGAKVGKGHRCLVGNSWGIVTTDLKLDYRPSSANSYVIEEIKALYDYAYNKPEKDFYIAYTNFTTFNLSGFTNQELADMFSYNKIPNNVIFEKGFSKLLTNKY